MKKSVLTILCMAILLLHSPVQAAAPVPWQNHARPWSFLFGNHIDMHQQSQQIDQNRLTGYLYIHYTGQFINGIPVAEHTDCNMPGANCIAGWTFAGIPTVGTVAGSDAMGAATWCVSTSVPPGFSHFHWLGAPAEDIGLTQGQVFTGYLLRLTASGTFYFLHLDMLILVRPGTDVISHANLATNCP